MPADRASEQDVADVRPRGRRARGEDARTEIVEAAREEFTEAGYERTSVRGIARRSGVDPALVRYYFPGGKAELFAVAFVDRGIDPGRLLEEALAEGLDGLGSRLAERVLLTWDAHGGAERFRVLFAAAATGQDTLLRDFLTREIFGRLSGALEGPDVRERLTMVAVTMVGMLVTRYILALEPLASMPPAEVAARIGPVIDGWLTGLDRT